MYSVLLMAALTTTPATQAWHRGCYGARGCHGCYGTSYTASPACFGCSGYQAAGYGSGCYGCYGYPWYGSHGWHGAWGGYLGTGHAPFGAFQCHGCYGCYGGGSCYGMPTHHVAVTPAPPSTDRPPPPPDKKPGKFEQIPPPKEKKGSEEQVRAKVTIDLPADAKLYIDGTPMRSTSARRAFQTPNLVPGQMYYYQFRAEVVRAGRVISDTRRVVVQPGQDASASFATLGQPSEPAARGGEK
jgi:uncharacterized protein (TIGR03000 family)